MRVPKQALISLGTAIPALALLIGLILVSHPAPVAPTHTVNFHSASITTDADSIPTTPTPIAVPALTTDTTSPDTTSTDQTPAQTQTVAQTPAADDPTPPDPIVATDAEVTGWSDPAPTESRFRVGTTPVATVVQYRYCIWTYSDGSTQQQLYATKYATISGGMSSLEDPTYDCTIANAPAPAAP